MAEQEIDYSSLPLPDRFAHKVWKVRKEAYEAAAKEFDTAQTESDPVVRQFVNDSSLWKGAVSDSNVAAHQEALNALCSFLQIGGTQGAVRTRNVTIAPLAEKGLVSTKPAAKQKALEAILLYIEMDKPDPIIEELLPLLSHKTPKVVAATLSAFTAIYHAYGCKTVDPKPVLKTLPKVFGHADKNVRTEAQNLTVELYRWLREGMKSMFWNDLKPVQQTDLEKMFETVNSEPPPKPERLLKSQQAAVERAAAAAPTADEDTGEDDVGGEAEFEPELVTVNVFAKIPKDFQERLASAKWKDRKEALDELHTAINVSAIEEGPFDDVIRGLAKSMKDANIAVVTVAANCIELLAKGLRKGFAKYRSMIMGPVMERLKERKPSVIEALAAALDAAFASTNLQDCLEEALSFLQHKNPQVKLESTKFLTRCLKTTKDAPSIAETKSISDAANKLLTDPQEIQRNAAAEVLGTLWKIMGDRIMTTHLDNLDDIRKAKVKEYFDGAEVRTKYKPKSAPPPAAKGAPTPSGKKPLAKKPAAGTAPKKAPAPAASIVDEQPPPALQARPTSRPAGLAKPTAAAAAAGRGLKPPTGSVLNKKLPAPPASQNPTPASPRRAAAASPAEEETTPAPAPKMMSRGLTSRTLAKPSAIAPQEPVEAPQIISNALPSAERLELDELRIEVERLRSANETLRSDNNKLSSQVNELQNQNAQLIEDHTRDVLSIKAKETQLVRARSDAETAEQSAQQMQREVERLKRELGRMGRASSPRASGYGAGDIFQDGSLSATKRAGVTSPTFSNHQESASSRPLSQSPARANSVSSNNSGYQRPSSRPALTAPSSNGYAHNANSFSNRMQNINGNPAGISETDARSSGGSTTENQGLNNSGNSGSGNVESWKRAAEVTQNLKARIELMKAKQGIQR